MEGWSDNSHADAFTHTVRLADDRAHVEIAAVCTGSPEYAIRSASARVLAGDVDAGAASGLSALAGTRMVGGLTRRLLELAGTGPGASLLVDAGIEVARLARQVARVPSEVTAAITPGDARAYWNLDTTSWTDLPGSCFTYSDAGRARFAAGAVTTPIPLAIYSPAPGAVRIFQRRKVSRLVRTGARLDLFQSMHDDVHGFDVHYEIDVATGTIVAADSVVSRLPYRGICDEPQRRIAAMIGQPVDALLRKRSQTLLGGEIGCAQLFDLTGDVLKLLA